MAEGGEEIGDRPTKVCPLLMPRVEGTSQAMQLLLPCMPQNHGPLGWKERRNARHWPRPSPQNHTRSTEDCLKTFALARKWLAQVTSFKSSQFNLLSHQGHVDKHDQSQLSASFSFGRLRALGWWTSPASFAMAAINLDLSAGLNVKCSNP